MFIISLSEILDNNYAKQTKFDFYIQNLLTDLREGFDGKVHVLGIFNGCTTDKEMLTKSTQKLSTLKLADAIFGDRRLVKQRSQPVRQVCALL